jgi:predicted NUDIX family NTP pyrophosphohydrolase
MLKRSSGILVYRKINNKVEILLCHMGGPYFENKDKWSLPKGEHRNENSISAAIREFNEETSFKVKKEDLKFLGSHKQKNKKLVTIFYTEGNYDASKGFSNTFKKEWPKGSGRIKEFPEMDKYSWMTIEEAKEKILKGQVYFINKLDYILKETNNE